MLRPDSAGHLYHRLRRLVLKYSSDLNPIELAFSKLKAHLRKAAEHTIPRLLRRIGRVVTDFSSAPPQINSTPCPHRDTPGESSGVFYPDAVTS
jgi:hypothetical protein